MDFKQLQSFVTVVRYQSFTVAASRLGISQPTVSTHIRMLEEELGIPLVIRTAKRVDLTPQGKQIFDQVINILSMRDRLLKSNRLRDQNTVYIGASSIPSAYLLPDIMKGFSAKRIDANFVITQGDSQDVISGLTESTYDVGFIGMDADEESLECVPFAKDTLVLVTPVSARFDRESYSLEEIRKLLLKENVLLRREGSASRSVVDRIFDDLDIDEDKVRIAARVNDQETIKNLVESGYGITIASQRAVQEKVEQGRLRTFAIPGARCERNFYIVYRKGTVMPLIEDFIDFVFLMYTDTVQLSDKKTEE